MCFKNRKTSTLHVKLEDDGGPDVGVVGWPPPDDRLLVSPINELFDSPAIGNSILISDDTYAPFLPSKNSVKTHRKQNVKHAKREMIFFIVMNVVVKKCVA
jgi:hypothetical protein